MLRQRCENTLNQNPAKHLADIPGDVTKGVKFSITKFKIFDLVDNVITFDQKAQAHFPVILTSLLHCSLLICKLNKMY